MNTENNWSVVDQDKNKYGEHLTQFEAEVLLTRCLNEDIEAYLTQQNSRVIN